MKVTKEMYDKELQAQITKFELGFTDQKVY